jgi:MFS superfamily sulfate permease-like transporter
MKLEELEVPKEGLAGLTQNWKSDIISGFLVFLIALPLCLGIAMASGFPAIGGIMTAIVGGILVTFFQGSYATIKGPAAGLIVIVIGSVETLGKGDMWMGYKLTLAVIVVAGIIQILFGIFRTGVLGDFFPSSAVHGMLAAIGVIIAAKQIHSAIGVKPEAKGTFGIIAEIPHSVMHLNPEIAVIGGISLLILFLLPLVKNKYVKMIPAPMLVILISIPLGYYFDLEHTHKYLVNGAEFEVGPSYLVSLPNNILDGFEMPIWTHIMDADSIKYIILFALVGSLESLISTKAVDILDPYKRKSNLNKDLLAVGIGNTICGFIGALPMISEIVRSSANINNGGKTKWSNFFHGIFLLGFVAFAPGLIHHIPLSALAAMLIFTGYRLASPKVFRETYKVGKEQLAIFVITIIITLAEGLLEGIFAGILAKFILHLYSGAPLGSLFRSKVQVVKGHDNVYTLSLTDAAIFSNYLGFKRVLDKIPAGNQIVLDFSNVKIVDHTVMEHLHHYGEDYHRGGGEMVIKGMEKLKAMSSHPLSYRVLQKETQASEVMDSRDKELRSFAKSLGFSYQSTNQANQSNFGRFSAEPLRVKYEGNIISGKISDHHYHLSDLSIVRGGEFKAQIYHVSVLSISNLHMGIPIFTMEKEVLMDKIMEKAFINDIDFKEFPAFSNKYTLKGINEAQIRRFFTKDVIEYFENNDIYSIESLGAELLIYKSNRVASVEELRQLVDFGRGLVEVISRIKQEVE